MRRPMIIGFSNSFRRNQIKWIFCVFVFVFRRQSSRDRQRPNGKWSRKLQRKTEERAKKKTKIKSEMHEKEEQSRLVGLWTAVVATNKLLQHTIGLGGPVDVRHALPCYLCCFSNSMQDFSDSLTICNYNLPSTINTWFRLKFLPSESQRLLCMCVWVRLHDNQRTLVATCFRTHTHTTSIPKLNEAHAFPLHGNTYDESRVVIILRIMCCSPCVHCKSTIIRCNFILAKPTDKYMDQWRAMQDAPHVAIEKHKFFI